MLEIQLLDPQRHDRQAFTSAVDALTQKKLPRYPVPCFRLGRLAVDSAHQGKGLGRLLLGCAVEHCLEARKTVAAYALVVDAKVEEARAFYVHYGFLSCKDNPMTLYLSLGIFWQS